MGVSRIVEATASTLWRTLATIVILISIVVGPAVIQFKLSIGGSIALYFIVWWTVLFAVLPFASRRGTVGVGDISGADPGAPADPRLRVHAIWTTIFSDVVFLAAVAAFPLAGL